MLRITDKSYRALKGIYIIKNIINGKEYIGQSVNIKRRMCGYNRTAANMAILRAIKKYGIMNFQVYVEYLPLMTTEELGKEEAKRIKECATRTPAGYNVASGGLVNRGWKASKEAREKQSAARKGKYCGEQHPMFGKSHSVSTRKKMSDSKKGENHNMFGKTHRKETREKMSEKQSGEKNSFFGRRHSESTRKEMSNSRKGEKSPMAKRVTQYSKTNDFIRHWTCIAAACRELGISASNISSCCAGRLKSSGGFIWTACSAPV